MRSKTSDVVSYQKPQLLKQASELAKYIQTLSPQQLAKSMHFSDDMAEKTQQLMSSWTASPEKQLPAIDAFLGDIYSGLQVQIFSEEDRTFANDHLYILSGLYGVLRALDSIYPYRLEMGYRLPDEPYKNLYTFWNDSIAKCIPNDQPVINLSAVEYTKAVLPYLPNVKVVSPKFMTLDPKTDEPKFTVVHAKIARGAFARWLIQQRVDSLDNLKDFKDLGYEYNSELSTTEVPVFICKEFKGIGLSVRLT
jgi:cytoplasmic iron level regulating protein YaaA (DUF328/UPF0246 family)